MMVFNKPKGAGLYVCSIRLYFILKHMFMILQVYTCTFFSSLLKYIVYLCALSVLLCVSYKKACLEKEI